MTRKSGVAGGVVRQLHQEMQGLDRQSVQSGKVLAQTKQARPSVIVWTQASHFAFAQRQVTQQSCHPITQSRFNCRIQTLDFDKLQKWRLVLDLRRQKRRCNSIYQSIIHSTFGEIISGLTKTYNTPGVGIISQQTVYEILF